MKFRLVRVGGWVGGWVAGLIENITNSAQLRLGLGLSLVICNLLQENLKIKINEQNKQTNRQENG